MRFRFFVFRIVPPETQCRDSLVLAGEIIRECCNPLFSINDHAGDEISEVPVPDPLTHADRGAGR